MKLRKGDQVKIMSGKDRGKTGTILSSQPSAGTVVVEGLNVFKKRARPKRQGETGQMIAVSRPFPASKAMLICKSCKEPTRVGARIENGVRLRYCKKCKANT